VPRLDDLLLFADDAAILKRPHAAVRSCRETMHALGFAIGRDGLRALPRSRRKLRAMVSNWVFTGRPGRAAVARSLAARMGSLLP